MVDENTAFKVVDAAMFKLLGIEDTSSLTSKAFALHNDSGNHLPHHNFDGTVSRVCVMTGLALARGLLFKGNQKYDIGAETLAHLEQHEMELGIMKLSVKGEAKSFSSGGKVTFESKGNMLKVSGKLLGVGTFTGLDGIPTTFDANSIKRLYDKIALESKPLVLTHIVGKACPIVVGFAYKYALDKGTDSILFEGLVFSHQAIMEIASGGFDNVSLEGNMHTNSNNSVVDGNIDKIALVQHPAVGDAQIKYTAIQMGAGRLNMPESIEETRALLKEKGLTPTEIAAVFNSIEGNHIAAADVAKTEMSKVTTELGVYKTKFADIQKGELDTLKGKLIDLGVKDPNSLIVDMEPDMQVKVFANLHEQLTLADGSGGAPPGGKPNPDEEDEEEETPEKIAKATQEAIAELGVSELASELLVQEGV